MLRITFLIVWVGLAFTIAGPLPVSAETRRVVLLFDERVELPGMSRLDAEFIRTLQANSADPVEVYREAMDLSRFGSDKYKSSLRDFLRTKYADKKIDVAVAVIAVFLGLGLIDVAHFPQVLMLALYLVLALVALFLLRIGLHLALLHEAHDEIHSDEPLLCTHCGHVVPDMAFCPACGVATRASSRSSRKERRETRPVRSAPEGS